ncbi:hypothetical protein CONCODRAFT_3808 [Conidiobolus coronatus NRRL 28638]|uniref:Uncharacterized protein n=1 Tax=Conidiobolus coronatus (strain ATCC 28846 / CBS 209.66 / NRRL 28638) TaxID=796925 RepID=A0A137PDR7_CONC2|nr:hypothetical protein CONCODRAFT_3808 [Conidiobolus coronatus NRRL 28638]|eukprot:KXN73146.1 hypothetical protein CONCODRAFT_3808 [Conidiobolus coronatus NRRL 28638]
MVYKILSNLKENCYFKSLNFLHNLKTSYLDDIWDTIAFIDKGEHNHCTWFYNSIDLLGNSDIKDYNKIYELFDTRKHNLNPCKSADRDRISKDVVDRYRYSAWYCCSPVLSNDVLLNTDYYYARDEMYSSHMGDEALICESFDFKGKDLIKCTEFNESFFCDFKNNLNTDLNGKVYEIENNLTLRDSYKILKNVLNITDEPFNPKYSYDIKVTVESSPDEGLSLQNPFPLPQEE